MLIWGKTRARMKQRPVNHSKKNPQGSKRVSGTRTKTTPQGSNRVSDTKTIKHIGPPTPISHPIFNTKPNTSHRGPGSSLNGKHDMPFQEFLNTYGNLATKYGSEYLKGKAADELRIMELAKLNTTQSNRNQAKRNQANAKTAIIRQSVQTRKKKAKNEQALLDLKTQIQQETLMRQNAANQSRKQIQKNQAKIWEYAAERFNSKRNRELQENVTALGKYFSGQLPATTTETPGTLNDLHLTSAVNYKPKNKYIMPFSGLENNEFLNEFKKK